MSNIISGVTGNLNKITKTLTFLKTKTEKYLNLNKMENNWRKLMLTNGN